MTTVTTQDEQEMIQVMSGPDGATAVLLVYGECSWLVERESLARSIAAAKGVLRDYRHSTYTVRAECTPSDLWATITPVFSAKDMPADALAKLRDTAQNDPDPVVREVAQREFDARHWSLRPWPGKRA